MNFKIDNLQYCKWDRSVFEINREAGLDAVHVTIVYHEDFDELLLEMKKYWQSVKWKIDIPKESNMKEAGLLKLTCDKINNHLK